MVPPVTSMRSYIAAMRVIVKPGGHHNYIVVSDREGSVTYLHGGNPSSQSVPSLQEFEVSEAILSQVTGS